MPGPANSLNISETGFQSFDGVSIFKGRTFTAGAGITITNGTGVSGNPTISVTGGAAVTSVLTANATPQFVLFGSTETVDFGITNLILGSSATSLAGGIQNTGLGYHSLFALTNGSANTAVGYLSMVTNNGGAHNTAVGFSSLATCTIGASNTCVGDAALSSLTTTNNNVAFGANALLNLVTGASNIVLGTSAGVNYTGAESNNIIIGNRGIDFSGASTVGESFVTRIGSTGVGGIVDCYLVGRLSTNSGRVVNTTVPGAYPYTTLTTDYVVLVDTSAARTINLVATPVTGTTYRIKDNVGTAAAFNITITPAAGTIDGAASYVISSNWGSVDVIYQGTSWRVL